MALTGSLATASGSTALVRGFPSRVIGLWSARTHTCTRIFGGVLTGGCWVRDDLRSVFQLLLSIGNDLFTLVEARGENDEIAFGEVDLDRFGDDRIRGLAGDVRGSVGTGGLTLVR